MADALRAASRSADFLAAASITLVETSPVLRAAQRRSLDGYDVTWRGTLDAVADGPVLLIANEFFDALPAHQLVRTEDDWRERLVGLNDSGFRFVLSHHAPPIAALLPPELRNDAPVGAIAEIQPAGLAIAAALAERIETDGGAALIIDYGHARSAAGETLQAVRRHEPRDIFNAPGETDLTVHVDFAALTRTAAEKAEVMGPCDQGSFLRRMGIAARAERLTAQATPAQADEIASGVERLIADDRMGTLFKVLCLARRGTPPLPGFEH
jgi:NADH dehydrogenase [ubiquinone] 1 alpha subcomplex assembly factor 7